VSSALGNVWATCGAPNSLLLVMFLSEWLRAEKWQIGLVLAITNLGPTLEPLGAWLVERLGHRKRQFLITHLLNRLPFFSFALLPWLDREGGGGPAALALVYAVVVGTRVAGHLGTAAWWSWIADLVPGRSRGRWLGCRVGWNSLVTAVSFVTVGWLLQHGGGMRDPLLLSTLFAAGAAFGVADILLYFAVPDVPLNARRPGVGLGEFCRQAAAPFRDEGFRRLVLGVGLWSLAVNLVVPFIPLYLKGGPRDPLHPGLGVTWPYLAAFNVCTQLGMALASRTWGLWCGRIGPRLLLTIGSGHFFVLLAFLLVGRRHYEAPLLLTALVSGILQSAWTVGTQQALLEMAPGGNHGYRTSAYNLANGWFTGAGSILGGLVAAAWPLAGFRLPSGLPCAYLHVLLLCGTVLGLAAVMLVRRATTPATTLPPARVLAWRLAARSRPGERGFRPEGGGVHAAEAAR
jgi:MFS family permease